MPGDLEGAARQLEFLRGLFRGGRMSEGEAADAACEGVLDLLRGLADQVDQLRGEVAGLRQEVERLRAGAEAASAASMDEDGRIACPDCGQRLAVGSAVPSGKAVEVTCPSCNALLEVS